MCGCLSHHPPTGDLASNPGMCPDWEWNRQPFDSKAIAQSTEPHQPGQMTDFYMVLILEFYICQDSPEKQNQWRLRSVTTSPVQAGDPGRSVVYSSKA